MELQGEGQTEEDLGLKKRDRLGYQCSKRESQSSVVEEGGRDGQMLDSGSTLKVEKITSADNLDIRRGKRAVKDDSQVFEQLGEFWDAEVRHLGGGTDVESGVLLWPCQDGDAEQAVGYPSWISEVQVGTGKLIWESLGNSHDIG